MVLAKQCRWLTDRASEGSHYAAAKSLYVTRLEVLHTSKAVEIEQALWS